MASILETTHDSQVIEDRIKELRLLVLEMQIKPCKGFKSFVFWEVPRPSENCIEYGVSGLRCLCSTADTACAC